MLAVHPLPTSTAIANVVAAVVAAPAKHRASKDEIRMLISDQPIYKPIDAARLCGVSEDTVTRTIASRPGCFPTRHWARRHEWTRDEFIEVVWNLCGIKGRANLGLQKNICGKTAGELRES